MDIQKKMEEQIDNRFIDIYDISWKKVKEQNVFALKIDMEKLNINTIKNQIRRLLKIKRKVEKHNIPVGIEGNNMFIYNYSDKGKNSDIINALKAVMINGYRERYTYIYNTVCDYLDVFFYERNLCDFRHDKCGEKRCTNSTIGCCRHYKYRLLGPFNTKFVQCEYLKDKKCAAKCLPCKLFTCNYLEKKGIKFKIKDILLLDVFFNVFQKYTLKTMNYTPQEKIINKLLKQRLIWTI